MRRYSLYFLTTIALLIAACSTINVHHVENSKAAVMNDGIYYSLPKTVISVEVTVDKINKVKGPYSEYAAKYLGISNIIGENSVSYSLGNIKINSYSVPDPAQYYFVELPKCGHKKNAVILQLSESGIINSINAPGEMKSSNGVNPATEKTDELNEPPSLTFLSSGLAETFDTSIIPVYLDTTFLMKKVIKRITVEKTDEQKAKEVSDLIMKVKGEKFNMIRGYDEVNYSKESIEYMTQQLDKLETEYLNLFTGITVKHQLKYYFVFNPSYTENQVFTPLFRFSYKEGIVDTSNSHGENVYLHIQRSGNTKVVADFEKAKTDAKKKLHGYNYRIPEYTTVSILSNDKVKAETNILIDQYGAISELPIKKNLNISYYPNSGSLKTVAYKKRWFHFGGHH
ncbi:MAG: DUF4831 family protein [Bacteroidales bacterium]|jgi:hypothetical protein